MVSRDLLKTPSKMLDEMTADASKQLLSSVLSAQLNPQRFNGASLSGLHGSVVKGHGHATATGFSFAIEQAIFEIEYAVPQLIGERTACITLSNQGKLTGTRN